MRKVVFDLATEDESSDSVLKLIKFSSTDEIELLANNTLASYLNDVSRYTEVTGSKALAVPFVTNHRYRFHFDTNRELDSLHLTVSEKYRAEDWPIILNTNYTEVREAFVVQSVVDGEPYEVIADGTLLADSLTWASGDHVLYDDQR